jgi:RNase adaptor protein for sRNA GlmZ degradation
MKSINFLRSEDVQIKMRYRNTQRARNVSTIIENLNRKGAPSVLFIDATDAAKYERYALQKALHVAGAHVLVASGVNEKTNKPVLAIKRLTDAEWKEYLSAQK